MHRALIFISLSLFSLSLFASESELGLLSLEQVQAQTQSIFHAKRTFRFIEEAFDSSTDLVNSNLGGLHGVESVDLGLSCGLSSRGGFLPENAYALIGIEFLGDGLRLTFETFKNLFFQKAYAFIKCEKFEPEEEPQNSLEELLLTDFIDFFEAIEAFPSSASSD